MIAAAIFYPEDINLIEDALSEVCSKRGLSPDSVEAKTVAIELLDRFHAGIQDLDGLVRSLRAA